VALRASSSDWPSNSAETSDCSLSTPTFVAEISVNGVRFTTLADPEGNAFDVAAA
jgi:hypothetical protein